HTLVQIAHRLESEGRNLYRVQAYRRAAETILGLDRQLDEVVAESGAAGLRKLPGIGWSLARKLANLVHTGDFATLTAETKPSLGVPRQTATIPSPDPNGPLDAASPPVSGNGAL